MGMLSARSCDEALVGDWESRLSVDKQGWRFLKLYLYFYFVRFILVLIQLQEISKLSSRERQSLPKSPTCALELHNLNSDGHFRHQLDFAQTKHFKDNKAHWSVAAVAA